MGRKRHITSVMCGFAESLHQENQFSECNDSVNPTLPLCSWFFSFPCKSRIQDPPITSPRRTQMKVFQITNIKDFMNKLLLSELFDHFLLSEASIQTKVTYIIDPFFKAVAFSFHNSLLSLFLISQYRFISRIQLSLHISSIPYVGTCSIHRIPPVIHFRNGWTWEGIL